MFVNEDWEIRQGSQNGPTPHDDFYAGGGGGGKGDERVDGDKEGVVEVGWGKH